MVYGFSFYLLCFSIMIVLIVIAYGSFGTPFLTSDGMNASGASALISIVISQAQYLSFYPSDALVN